MQQDKNFKAVSAILEELIELIARYNRLVDKISSAEESASIVEFELTNLQQKLKEIVSSNRPGRAPTKKHSNARRGIFLRDGRSSAPDAHSARFTEPPSSLYEEIVDFFNLFLSVGKRYGELAGRINSVDDTAINIDFALRRIQERLKDLIQKDLMAFNSTGITPVSLKINQLPPDVVKALRWSAESGVSYLGTKRFANGTAEFEIEGTKLTLSPSLTKLLIALSKDIGSSEDDLVGYKSFEELIQSLYGPKHGTLSGDSQDLKDIKHRIVQGIYLLKKSFSTAGMNPFLIQNNPQLGYRFALKRKEQLGKAACLL